MKKAKIMLAILAVVAAVGGGLAFKAKTYSLHNYCVGTTAIGNTTCGTFSAAVKVEGNVTLLYTTVTEQAACPAAGIPCTAKAELLAE